MATIFAKRRAPARRMTDHLNLLICGAQRSGTTSLKYYLEEHPAIGFLGEGDLEVDGRYVGFPFASPTCWKASLGEGGEAYRAISRRHAGQKQWIGTKQPYFMVQPQVPLNLAEHLPDARLLFVLRNPIETAYSVYCKGLAQGRRRGSFREHLNLSLAAARDLSHPSERGAWLRYFEDPEAVPFLIDRGFYAQQLDRFYRCLPAEQILVLSFEEFTQTPQESMRRVLGFLDLDDDFTFERIGAVKNAAPKPEPMDAETRALLDDIYRDSNRRLFKRLGWPSDHW